MTISLVIDTSTSRTTAALVKNGQSLISLHHDDPLAHGEALPKMVATILESEFKIDRVVVGMGPGPFTGLRSGIAFAQSFSLARNIPCVGVCSLDGIVSLEASEGGRKYIVATDARRKEVFWASYTNGVRDGEPQVGSPITLRFLKVIAYGEGAEKYSFSTSSDFTYPDPVTLEAVAASGVIYKVPIYIRRPDAFAAPVGVTFRAMNALDLVSIFDIEKKSYLEDPWSMGQLKEELAGKNRWYLIAEFTGTVVGYVGGLHIDDITDVLTLTVHPDFRRRGIAREMLRRLIDWSRTQKANAIMLEVRKGNEAALPLYQAFGFVEISRRENYYGPGITGVIMRKDLS